MKLDIGVFRNVFLLLAFTLSQLIEDASASSGWSLWSEWSACSRTCDGGASYQLRRCNRWRCHGDGIRYRRCNTKPCAKGHVDFRTQQCSAYNDVPYYGEFYKWVPYHEPRDPCSLRCKPIGKGFGVMLAPKVLDGTRCNGHSDSFDMCINGKCRTVGCDGLLDSKLLPDECGVCGGDGSSCQQSEQPARFHWQETDFSECSVTCGVGYRMSRVVCKDTWNNYIIHDRYCFKGTKPKPRTVQCKRARCKPYWEPSGWSPCSKSCGGGVMKRKYSCMKDVEHKPAVIVDHRLCVEAKPVMKKMCNMQDCPRWYAGAWSLCSVTCHVGWQYREVICKQVDDRQPCQLSNKPVTRQRCDTQVPCLGETAETIDRLSETSEVQGLDTSNAVNSTQSDNPPMMGDQGISTTPSFIATEWGPCSTTCGPGVKIRLVQCKVYLEFSKTVVDVPDDDCAGPKPTEIETCSYGNCTEVGLVVDGDDSNVPPADIYLWHEVGWTPCSATCLGGYESSIIECVRASDHAAVDDIMCNDLPIIPSTTRPCGESPCPPRFRVGTWGHCSATCGPGTQTRHVDCIQQLARGEEFTAVVPDVVCADEMPARVQECHLGSCPPVWLVGNWTECSSPCGGGFQTRPVVCQQMTSSGNYVNLTNEFECLQEKPEFERWCNTMDCVNEVVPKAPKIRKEKSHYVQLNALKRVVVIVGGKVTVIPKTTILVRCPVRNFNQPDVIWKHNTIEIPKSGDKTRVMVISKNGILRIRKGRLKDVGIYTCHAGGEKASIILEFHSLEKAKRLLLYRTQYLNQKLLPGQVGGSSNASPDDNSVTLPVYYIPANWTSCSKTCGGQGTQYRFVDCEIITADYYKVVDETYCRDSGHNKPPETRACGWSECPNWALGEWDECSELNCNGNGTSLQTMTLYCAMSNGTYVDNKYCDILTKPVQTRECVRPECHPEWHTSEWSKCSRSCGGEGIQTRMLKCVWSGSGLHAGTNCRDMPRPPVTMPCHTPRCPKLSKAPDSQSKDCYDQSKFCSLVVRLSLCKLKDYRRRCCHSCYDQ